MTAPMTAGSAPARATARSVGSLAIVADDLTGANDSAVQFARAGWVARLALGDAAEQHGADGSVVAIVTDARALDPARARAATAAAVGTAVANGDRRVFLKIDSTMRGSVADQVVGAIESWSTREPGAFAVVCPAYPAMGRTVVDGRLLVDGSGVETTSVGRDPVTPVTTSSMAELVPGSARVAVLPDDTARRLADRIADRVDAGASVAAVDAASDSDLRLLADALMLLGPRAVPVGSAGLAVEMARVWGAGLTSSGAVNIGAEPASWTAPRHVVVVVSSLHEVSRAQHAHLVEAAGSDSLPETVRTLAPTIDDVLDDRLAAFLGRTLSAGDAPAVTVVLAPARDADRVRTVPAGMPTAAEQVAAALALIADRVVAHHGAAALVLMGGEGARAVLTRQGADAILVRDSIREGLPRGVIEGGRLHGMPVITKAGGFGTPSSLTDIVPELLDPRPTDPTTQGERA